MGTVNRPVHVVAILGIVALLILSAGCSMRVYTRGMDGSGPHRELTEGATLAVLADELGPEGSGDEVGTVNKLESLLDDQGYDITDPCEADFLVLYHYETSTESHRRFIEPLSGPTAGMRTVERRGPFDHTLHLRVVEAKPYLADRETRLVWAGAALVPSAPTESSRFMDMALICAVEDFGEVSDDMVESNMRYYDRRIRELD